MWLASAKDKASATIRREATQVNREKKQPVEWYSNIESKWASQATANHRQELITHCIDHPKISQPSKISQTNLTVPSAKVSIISTKYWSLKKYSKYQAKPKWDWNINTLKREKSSIDLVKIFQQERTNEIYLNKTKPVRTKH